MSKENKKEEQVVKENTLGKKILETAQQYLNIPYPASGGGDGVNTMDCGLLTQLTYEACKVQIGDSTYPIRRADAQFLYFKKKGLIFEAEDAVILGDLVFFMNLAEEGCYEDCKIFHVGIALGDGRMIHAGCTAGVCYEKIENIGYSTRVDKVYYARVNPDIKLGDNVKQIKLEDDIITSSLSSSDVSCASISSRTAGKIVYLTKNPANKTYSEPIYPDLITVSDTVPEIVVSSLIDDANKNKEGKGGNGNFDVANKLPDTEVGMDYVNVLSQQQQMKACQHLLNPYDYANELKTPNPGKPVNNRDPYPVDLKIEELEYHKPNIVKKSISCCAKSKDLGKAFLRTNDATEKRIVKLENMLATAMRYIFRLGARVPINCVYYGGQTPFEKYKAIRCLHHDRVNDGQCVQIDQCLNCTRYEPVHGQVYEIMNDLGANVAAILDDNQMAYQDMSKYIELTRLEAEQKKRKEAKIAGIIDQRDIDEYDFDEIWGTGEVMKWNLVPKEKQVPHINWRQSIIDSEPSKMYLESYTGSEINSGINMVLDVDYSKFVTHNINAMSRYDLYAKTIADCKAGASGKDLAEQCLDEIRKGEQRLIKQSVKSTPIDSLFLSCLDFLIAKDPQNTAKKYLEIEQKLNVHNPAVVVAAYIFGIDAIMGNEEKGIKRIDLLYRKHPSNKDGSDSADKMTIIDWSKVESWTYPEINEKLHIQQLPEIKLNMDPFTVFPKLCHLYNELYPKSRRSRFDNDTYNFPFTDQELAMNRVIYRQKYRTPQNNCIFTGIQLEAEAGTPVYAVHDGVVKSAGDGWGKKYNSITIQHDGIDTYSRYMHCSVLKVKTGDKVKKGQMIGLVGNINTELGLSYLQFEMSAGDANETVSPTDPLHYYSKFAYKVGEQVKPYD